MSVTACHSINTAKGILGRVAVPPKDQQHVDRLGLLYFSRYVGCRSCLTVWYLNPVLFSPNNDVPLKTITESPVLREQGFTQNEFEKSGNPVPTMESE